MRYAETFNAVTDTVTIQIVGAVIGILSIIATRLIDRWLPPMDHKHKHRKRDDEDDE